MKRIEIEFNEASQIKADFLRGVNIKYLTKKEVQYGILKGKLEAFKDLGKWTFECESGEDGKMNPFSFVCEAEKVDVVVSIFFDKLVKTLNENLKP